MKANHNLFDSKSNNGHVLYDDSNAIEKISLNLLSYIPVNYAQSIVIACIGTDRSTGDSLGPLVGTFLSEKSDSPFFVYGTLDDPIHAVNLQEKMTEIKNKHQDSFIIAVDACLGRLKSVGTVQIADGPLKPGAGVNKILPEVGDIHVTGIVNVSGFMEFFVLQNTRLNLVLRMARTIADSIYQTSRALTIAPKPAAIDWASFEQKEATP